jgi:AraC family transcriptional regulator, activator of mtrCDE
MPSHAETIADWFLSGLELKSTVFHVGQYCGNWQASTAGRHQASFHLALHGECWLHLPETAERPGRSVKLFPGDAVFLLHHMPHCLLPDPQPPARGQESERIGTMSPLTPSGDTLKTSGGSVGIASSSFRNSIAADVAGSCVGWSVTDGLRRILSSGHGAQTLSSSAQNPRAIRSV